jgi:putative nucleotidyltransferase with HDIG domain
MHALAFVPLMVEHQAMGVLGVGCQHPVCSDDMRILNAIGDMAASALHRTRLHEQTRRRLERIQALHTIDQTITTSLNLRVTLNVLIFQVSSQLEADASAVLLFNPDTHHLEHAANYGFRTLSIQQSYLRLGEGFAGRTAMGQSFVHIPDVRQAETECMRPAMLKEEGFVSYYGVPLIARGRIKGVLEIFHRSVLKPDQEWLEFLGTLAGQASIAIDNADMFAQLQRSNTDLARAYDATIEGWARALELRDAETEGHCRRVTDLTVRLARRMGFSDEDIVHIRRGAILHDIGKMAIPDAILLKAGPLTEEERNAMQQHTVYAYKLLSPIPFLRSALDIPYCHHERWDGEGYPRGLKGEDIPMTARIFAVVDVWDALRSDRPYRSGWPKEHVFAYLLEHDGSHFDPQVVRVFLAMMRELSAQGG